MINLIKRLKSGRFPRTGVYTFSGNNGQRNKQNPVKFDYRNVVHTPTKRLEFERDGRCLLYFYEPNAPHKIALYSKSVGPILGIWQLIKANPFYMTFPVALPLMFMAEFYFLKKFWNMKTRFRNTIKEIYLHKEGDVIEIVYLNQFWRKLKKDDLSRIILIPNLDTEKYDEDFFKSGSVFPTEGSLESVNNLNWHWRKYFHGNNEWIEFPKNATYINEEILMASMAGKIIDTGENYVKNISYSLKERINIGFEDGDKVAKKDGEEVKE